MNKRFMLTLKLNTCILLFSYAGPQPHQNTEAGFAISGSLKGLPSGVKIYLLHLRTGTRKVDTAATAISKEGRFNFKGKVEQSAKFYTLFIDTVQYKFPKGKENYLLLLLDNSSLSINGDLNSWPDVKIAGSPSVTDYIEYLNLFAKLYEDLQAYNKLLNKQVDEVNKSLTIANQNADEFEINKANLIIDSLTKLFTKAEANYNAAFVSYIEAHPDSYLTPFTIMQAENQLGVEKLSLEYEKLTTRVKESLYGMHLKNRIYELYEIKEKLSKKDVGFEVGKIAPDFTAQTLPGTEMSLYDICKSGKVTLLDFWASWCKPCRAAFPDLKELYKKYHDKGFNVVSLSTDKDLKTWKEASDTDKLPWYDLSDVKAGKSFAEELYKIFKLPTTYLLDTNGKIIEIDVDKKKLEEILEELLKL